MWAFYDWIRDSVKQNKPWNQFAEDIFISSGSTRQNGALNYFVLHKDPIELTENATQAFLGQRITCARCHNHPAGEVDADAVLPDGQPLLARRRQERRHRRRDIVFAKASGDINHPRLPRPLPPTPLDGTAASPLDSPDDRRAALRRLAHQPAECDVRPHRRQPRLGQLHGPRPCRARGRPARHQSGVQRGAARGPVEGLRRTTVRHEAPDPHRS